MHRVGTGEIPPAADLAAPSSTPLAHGTLAADVRQQYVALGYKLGQMREDLAALCELPRDLDLVPWSIVPKLWGIPGTEENQPLIAEKQSKGAAWLRSFAAKLELVDQHLPRGGEEPSEQFLTVMREVGRMLRQQPEARLVQERVFHYDALPILQKLTTGQAS